MKKKRKISEIGILQSALGIAVHDEDIWESLCGCQGYRKIPGELPREEKECIKECSRKPWTQKKIMIYKEKYSEKITSESSKVYRCESWEKVVMDKRLMDKIKFEDNPIIFLLIFCDNVQDEGRVTSSDEQISKDRSSLKGINIDEKNGETIICINLDSYEKEKKEDEIKRIAWCLKDDRFRIYINEKLKIMNGSGGE